MKAGTIVKANGKSWVVESEEETKEFAKRRAEFSAKTKEQRDAEWRAAFPNAKF